MKLTWLLILNWTLVVKGIKWDSEKSQFWDSELALCQGIEIRELTINHAHMLFHRNKLSSAELTECYLSRIEIMNPILHAVIETNPDAIEIAKGLDEEFAATGKLKGILHGIPILIKDNIGTKDQMNTTGGAWGLLNAKPNNDARVVELLRKAGAIILGKANLSQLAGYSSENAPLGWSERGGLTKNPYNLTESASGSSSGSAAAVAANLALVALGTETNGSIIGPSEACGVFGLKPSVGYTSQFGLIPLAPSQDSIGVITRTVNDNFMVTLAISEEPLRNHLQELYDKNFKLAKKFRIGVFNRLYFRKNPKKTDMEPYRQKLRELQLRLITTKDHIIEDIPRGYFSKDIEDYEEKVMNFEFKHYLQSYLTKHTHGSQIKTLKDLIQFNNQHNPPHQYDQQTLINAVNSPNLNSTELQKKLAFIQLEAREKINLILDKNKFDMILIPSSTELRGFSPPDVAGYPIINIPIGIRDKNNVPIGFSLYGLPKSEPELLYMARIFEHLMPRSPPKFLM